MSIDRPNTAIPVGVIWILVSLFIMAVVRRSGPTFSEMLMALSAMLTIVWGVLIAREAKAGAVKYV